MHWRLQRADGNFVVFFHPIPYLAHKRRRGAQRGAIDMDNPADTLDQTDEDVLTYTVSDEALEAAAGEGGGVVSEVYRPTWVFACC
jgi:hypothetical protein